MAQQGGAAGPTPGTKAQPTNPWTASSQAMQGQGQLLANASQPGAMANAANAYQPPALSNAYDPGAMARAQGQYMNPYTNQVINRTTADMQRQGQMGLRDLGSTAHGQGAFGGSRHGIAEGTLMGEVNKNVGDMSAGLRQQGFDTSMGYAGQDIQNRMAGDVARQGQYFNRMGLGQQDIANQFQGAGALGGYGQQMFGLGQNMMNQQAQNGAQIGGINQGLIDQAAGMFDRYTGQPTQSTMGILAALSGNPLAGATTTTGTATPGTKSKIGGALGTAARIGSGGKGG